MSHPVIMGRKTFESIGKPLPGRTNIIVSHRRNWKVCGALVASSLEEAFRLCKECDELFVIGGASLYNQVLKFADKIYLTRIHHNFEGDTHLFNLDLNVWKETAREDFRPDATNLHPYSFLTYEKRNGKNAV